jgi:NADP-reducing hydrogenase subunit HndB
MDKIRSLQDILAKREQAQRKTSLREDGFHLCFTVHMGTCGIASGAREVVNSVAEEVEKSGRTDIRLTTSGCIGVCEHEPLMTVESIGNEPILYGRLDAQKARNVFQSTLAGKSASEYIVYIGSEPSDARTTGKGGKA